MRVKRALGRRTGWWVATGLLISGGALYLVGRRVNWTAFTEAVAHARPGWIVLGALTIFGAYVAIALRWWVLLRPRTPVSAGSAFEVTMIGTLGGFLTNARLGDAIRAVVLGRSRDVSASLVLGVVTVERLLDVGMVTTLAVGLSWVAPLPPHARTAAGILAVGAAGTLLVALLLVAGAARVRRALRTWPPLVPLGLRLRAGEILERFVEGVRVIGDARALVLGLVFSVLAWSLVAVSAACNLAALDLHPPWPAAPMVLLLVSLGGLIPAAPAGIGVYHYLAMLALASWVADPSAALGFAVINHATSAAVVLLVGTGCLLRRGIQWGYLRADRAC